MGRRRPPWWERYTFGRRSPKRPTRPLAAVDAREVTVEPTDCLS